MRTVLTLMAGKVVIVAATALAEGTTDDKKAEVIVYTVKVDEIAKEFKGDSKEAVKKYDPRPPKQGERMRSRVEGCQSCPALALLTSGQGKVLCSFQPFQRLIFGQVGHLLDATAA